MSEQTKRSDTSALPRTVTVIFLQPSCQSDNTWATSSTRFMMAVTAVVWTSGIYSGDFCLSSVIHQQQKSHPVGNTTMFNFNVPLIRTYEISLIWNTDDGNVLVIFLWKENLGEEKCETVKIINRSIFKRFPYQSQEICDSEVSSVKWPPRAGRLEVLR